MIIHCLVGMRNSHFIKTVVTGCFGSPTEKLQIHHIINNNRELPDFFIEVPGTDSSHPLVKTSRQRIGTGQHHLFIFRFAGQAITVSITAI